MHSPIYIHHDSFIYVIRYRDGIITSITRSMESNREPEPLEWSDLDEDVQEQVLNNLPEKDEP